MDIKDVDLLSLLPMFLQRDETARAMVKVLQPMLRDLGKHAGNALIFPRLNELDDTLVDELAWERHVDFYDPSLPLETKRELVRLSNEFHWYKGTPYAVQTMVDTLMENGTVREWFEYGGDPYTFKLDFDGGLKNPKAYESMLRAVSKVKNARSWLSGVTFKVRHDISIGLHTRTVRVKERRHYPAPIITTQECSVTVKTALATGMTRYRRYIPEPAVTTTTGKTTLQAACTTQATRYRFYPPAA